MAEIELHPDTTFCDVATLNRLARQQQLGASIARASIYDEICQAVAISEDDSAALVRMFLEREGLDPNQTDALERWLRSKGWTQEDLRYISSRWERIERFQTQVFAEEVERQFLSRKLAHDQVTYSMIRVRDGDLAFELHQRLLDEEASFGELASTYSEGPERDSEGICGPVPFDQAHATVVEQLRGCREGELLAPFFLVDIWLILRLEQWQGARLDDAMRSTLLEELFDQWLEQRITTLVEGRTPEPLPTHLLEQV